MATPAVAHRSLPDLDAARAAAASDHDDPLSPVRGILLALGLCAPFWLAAYVLLF